MKFIRLSMYDGRKADICVDSIVALTGTNERQREMGLQCDVLLAGNGVPVVEAADEILAMIEAARRTA